MEPIKQGADTLFILLGAVMVLAMHAGFAFLELGTVRKKNQVNALVKILVDFAISTMAYFFIGYTVAYGVTFFAGAESLAPKNGYELVRFFFLLTFAAAIPAIVSGGIAERAKFDPQLAATFLLVGLLYPFFEGDRVERALRRAGLVREHVRCTSSTTSPAASSCTRSAAGSRWSRWCCWARAAAAIARRAIVARIRHRAFRFLRSGVGAVGRLVRLQRDDAQTIDKISADWSRSTR